MHAKLNFNSFLNSEWGSLINGWIKYTMGNLISKVYFGEWVAHKFFAEIQP